MENKKIAIYGAGSLGTILGAYLTRAGLDVDLINRNVKHTNAMKEKGAHIVGTVDFTVPVKALFPDEMERKYDVIFLMTKQLDNHNVVTMLSNFLESDGIICTCQNGLPELSVSDVIGVERTYGCTIGWGATLLGEGVSELTSDPSVLTFSLGRMQGGTDENLIMLQKILSNMGPAEIDENFIGARWTKLMVNSTFSGMSAVTGVTFGEVVDDIEARTLCQRIMMECFAVAHEAGVKFEPMQGINFDKVFYYHNEEERLAQSEFLPKAMAKHRPLKASMLQDLEKGKPCEVNAINGTVSEYGRKVGVPTPICDEVVTIIKKCEKGELVPSLNNLKLFRGL